MRPPRCAVLVMAFLAHGAGAQFVQQGSKLVGTGAVGVAGQGSAVALSWDGNTAVVGGPSDNPYVGAAWVFTRSGGVWRQEGSKLVGAGAVGNVWQAQSVAISADGDTVVIGGAQDHYDDGAAWVFTRSGGAWSQQSTKLVGAGADRYAMQGRSVAISADGNTIIVGGPYDDSYNGAAWVFTRAFGVWRQQGDKLVGAGAVGSALQGSFVAVSADGDTAIVGGPGDGYGLGAAWVFTRSGGVWSQQGSKLVGTGAVGRSKQGQSVAISADGDTAIIGGPGDDSDGSSSSVGAVWVFTRRGEVWSQQGGKLVGAGAVGSAEQGSSVALSADGHTAIIGGPRDNYSSEASSGDGAAWVFRGCGGSWWQWGDKLVGTGAVAGPWRAAQGDSVAISGDGKTAIAGGPNDSTGSGAAWVFVAPDCAPPSITGQPQSQDFQNGQSGTLSVTATGGTPLCYDWYEGSSGDTSNPVGTGASSFTTPLLTITTSYWVRVRNACGSVDSATATITVGGGCTTPVIAAQPQSRFVQSGRAATLSVVAWGTPPLSYQWYLGASGDTSAPVHLFGTGSALTLWPQTATTRFWVRVSNACGHTDSVTATLGVAVGPRRHLERAK